MIRIVPYKTEDCKKWDQYVKCHPDASLYHLSSFKEVVENTYGHTSHYLQAIDDDSEIIGVLPLFFIRSLLFGRVLISLPFCDYGGILADNTEISIHLFNKAEQLLSDLNCDNIELRQSSVQLFLHNKLSEFSSRASVNTSKVRLSLDLPDSVDTLFGSFSAKLRSQIRKPQKEDCICLNGELELLNDFYDVFAFNMRDLGSPVHSKHMIKNMLRAYPQSSRLFVVYHRKKPVACSLVCGINDTLVNPWASFKRTYQRIAPNMLLYWEMLAFAIENGYKVFDFGRSTVNEGTYRFKTQWGATSQQLYWYNYGSDQYRSKDDSVKKNTFIKLWRMLPLGVTKLIGPLLRRHIHL